MARRDPHSYADDSHVEIHDFSWIASISFDTRTINATAVLSFAAKATAPNYVDLDTRDLTIESVAVQSNGEWVPAAFELGDRDTILGQRLRVQLDASAVREKGLIRIVYTTSPAASALQWLTPAQTAGGVHPFLFTQCQAIHARSIVPLQDTPRVRVTYRAELSVPAALRGLMAAEHEQRGEPTMDECVEWWVMPQAIPPYLFAFAVGDLASAELGPRSRVWAEPKVLSRAAHEFAQVDEMLRCAESLFGPYDWDRFDLLVMPPSFPYGGMENPRLTFLTPTLLAGDRSLVGVVAHELAHSWTGNLISAASAEHFWLNEGMTVWAERRITEALFGKETAALDAAQGRSDLDEALLGFASRPQLTHLRTCLDGIDPDEAFSSIPYEKGYLFVRALEDAVGRAAFDRFVASYVRTWRFRSITTDDFIALVRAALPRALETVRAGDYVDAPGIPANAPSVRSTRLDAIVALGDKIPDESFANGMHPTEWQLYLGKLPRPYPRVAELESRFALYARGNYEIRAAFVELALDSGLAGALEQAAALVGEVGRMKYLKPLYAAMVRSDRARTQKVFATLRPSYHPVAAQVVALLVDRQA